MLCFLQHFVGQFAIAGLAHVDAERGHYWTDVLRSDFRHTWNRCGGGHPGGSLQQAAPREICPTILYQHLRISIPSHT
jgi:hypothetical protein